MNVKIRKGFLSNFFKPLIYLRSFKDINVNRLKTYRIKLMISDLDNTLASSYTKFANKDVLELINQVQKSKIEFVLISNNIKKRVSRFAKKAGLDKFYWNAKKAFLKKTKKILQSRKELDFLEVIFVGDQIIVNILIANRLKCEFILVQPLVSNDYKMSSFNLFLENKIYKNLEKQNILKKGDFSSEKIGDYFELL